MLPVKHLIGSQFAELFLINYVNITTVTITTGLYSFFLKKRLRQVAKKGPQNIIYNIAETEMKVISMYT